MNPDPPVQAPSVAAGVRGIGLEIVISELLRWGVIASTSLIVVGMAVTFLRHPDYFQSTEALQRLTSPDRAPHSLEDVLTGLRDVRGTAIEMVGLLSLIALPVARVAFSLVVFATRKDRRFVWLSGMVLGLLTLSFLLGRAE
ncbi:MAG: DUF1634 domain-containing protein [Myxococcaceae bacterium]|nr:DUF1634 domain-containing protein [Myxococcaceae bacterium]